MYEGVWTYISCYLWSGMILLDMCPFFRWNGSSPREYLVMGIQPLTKVTPSSSQGKWWTCYITSPWDPPLGIPDLRRVGQERSRRFSAAPPEALRPLGDVWWRSWWQPHVWKKGTIPGDAHFRKRSFLWGAKEGSYILKRGEGFESHKDYSMLLGPGCNVFYIGAAQKSGTYHRIIIRQVPGFPGDELVATAISCVDRDTSVALSWCEELLVNPHSLSRYLGVWHWSTWTRGQATSLWSGPNIGQWNGGCRSPNLDWGLGPPEFDIPTK